MENIEITKNFEILDMDLSTLIEFSICLKNAKEVALAILKTSISKEFGKYNAETRSELLQSWFEYYDEQNQGLNKEEIIGFVSDDLVYSNRYKIIDGKTEVNVNFKDNVVKEIANILTKANEEKETRKIAVNLIAEGIDITTAFEKAVEIYSEQTIKVGA